MEIEFVPNHRITRSMIGDNGSSLYPRGMWEVESYGMFDLTGTSHSPSRQHDAK